MWKISKAVHRTALESNQINPYTMKQRASKSKFNETGG